MTQATTESAAEEDDNLLTTNRAAAKLGITRRYLYELMAAGEIATIRVGVQHRIEPAEIERFKDRNRQRAAT